MRLADEVARHGYHINRTSLQQRLEQMLTRAVRHAVARPDEASYRAALALITLAQRLNLEANIERAQESVYEALRGGARLTEGLRELAAQLHLASPLYRRPGEPATGPLPVLPEPPPVAVEASAESAV